jgi:hypothetical protein
MNTREGVSRYPQGFLLVDRESDLVWIYDRIPLGLSPTGYAFQVRMADGEQLISNTSAPKNRFRAADEREFDIRAAWWPSVAARDPYVDDPVSQWEEAYPTAVYAGEGDMAMGPDDLVTCTRRFMKVWARADDPRRCYLRGFSGWIGSGSPLRWDFNTNTVEPTTNDHEWHFAVEFLNVRIASRDVATAVMASIATGEPQHAWMLR